MSEPRRRKRPRIIWSEKARADLVRIGDYIAADNPKAAVRWVDKLVVLAEQAAQVPMAGRVVPELGRPDLRERLLRQYRVVYRLHDDGIEVVTVFEGHRRLRSDVVPDEE